MRQLGPILFLAFTLSASSQQVAPGDLLVATAKSHDPDFARSVILLIHYDAQSAVGLMLNKPASAPIPEVLPEAKGKTVEFYAGGPIAIGIDGLLRSKTPPFFTIISNKTELLKMISSGAPSGSFRLYAGYTGWTAQQLQSEIARGLWKVLPPRAGMAFDPHPDTLWLRLTLPRPIR